MFKLPSTSCVKLGTAERWKQTISHTEMVGSMIRKYANIIEWIFHPRTFTLCNRCRYKLNQGRNLIFIGRYFVELDHLKIHRERFDTKRRWLYIIFTSYQLIFFIIISISSPPFPGISANNKHGVYPGRTSEEIWIFQELIRISAINHGLSLIRQFWQPASGTSGWSGNGSVAWRWNLRVDFCLFLCKIWIWPDQVVNKEM